MAHVSPAGVKIKGIAQVALVVKDVQKTVENYWNILGIGPWGIYEMRSPMLTELTYHGKPGQFSMKVALTKVGTTELELIEPVSGDNIYSDFIAEHGEGFHHVQYVVDNVDEITQMMSKKGFPLLMSGHVGDSAFAYYDTVDAFKTIWEVWQPAKAMSPNYHYPEKETEISHARVKIKGINQVALVVKDLQQTMENYWNILGIGPWEFIHMRPPALSNRTYHGKPVRFTMKYAQAMIGEMDLEPVEPVSGNSIYSDFLAEHGEGLHHLMIAADNVDELVQRMSDSFPILMRGHINDGVFTYYDTVDALKTICEVWQPGKTMPTMNRYP